MIGGGCGFVKLEKKDKSGSLLFDEKGFFIRFQKIVVHICSPNNLVMIVGCKI
jgi:hypothetical protein